MIWVYILLATLLLVLVYVGWGVYQVLVIQTKTYARFWQAKAAEPVGDSAIRLVALGDSTFQAIGATKPMRGTVGRVAEYLTEQTNRPVHITNLSVTGARVADVVAQQLPQVDLASADIIIVAVGANDAFHSTELDQFADSYEKLCAVLPPEKTIIADVALVKQRADYQAKLEQARSNYGITTANLRDGFRNVRQPWRLTARDFFHPSDYGYSFWFAGFRPAVDALIAVRKLAK